MAGYARGLESKVMDLRIGLTERKTFLICFSVGVFLRLIPEVLAYPWPISWDMVHYAYFMRVGVVWQHWTSFFTSTWLLYSFLFPVHNLLGVDSFLLLKIVGPLLYGLNICGIYWFARSLLGWSRNISLVAGGFFALQLASLRISAEFLRNTLGLGLLLFTLPLIKRLDTRRGFMAFVVVSLLAVFAHEYAAVTLLVISLTLTVLGLVRNDRAWRVRWKRLIIAVLPALLVFMAGLYLRMFPVPFEGGSVVGPSLVWVEDTVRQSYGKLFFMVNYLGMNTGLDIYPNYLYLVVSVSALFAVLYLSYFFLVWKGFFRNKILDVWTGLLLVGSLGCLVMPFFALKYWHRWMFMLAYPFTFYAVNGARPGLKKMWKSLHTRGIKLGSFRNRPSMMFLATFLLGAIFLATPFLMVNVGFGIYSLYPACMYFGSAPTVPYQDVDETVQAMEWLETNMRDDSCAVLHNAFATWGKLYLDSSQDIIAYRIDVDLAVESALQGDYQHVYFVCWNQYIVLESSNWYGVYVPEGFDELQSFCRISVYEYQVA